MCISGRACISAHACVSDAALLPPPHPWGGFQMKLQEVATAGSCDASCDVCIMSGVCVIVLSSALCGRSASIYNVVRMKERLAPELNSSSGIFRPSTLVLGQDPVWTGKAGDIECVV